MQDARTQKQLEFARAVYLQRRQSFIDALAERGIMTDYLGAEESLSVWLKVPSEEKVVAFLLARDIIVMSGSDCGVTEGQYIRVSTSTIQPEQIAEIADAIAEACKTCQ